MGSAERHFDRADIADKVRALREERHLTQKELSRHLGLSQSRLSEIEHGRGSFTAEQFLTILQLFNVSAAHFVNKRPNRRGEIQNALARFGAFHLVEEPDVLPSEAFSELGTLVREVLAAPESPRQVTGLAPVLVQHPDRFRLSRVRNDLFALGLEGRLGWLVESVRNAIREELRTTKDRQWLARYKRAELIFDDFLATFRASEESRNQFDILDANVRSPKTLDRLRSEASPVSRRWRIATAIRNEDFVEALRASRRGTT